MNNETAQAIKHAVADGIREALDDAYDAGYIAACRLTPEQEQRVDECVKEQKKLRGTGAPLDPVCPHCGTPWTWYQRRGYSKHPCEAWRTKRASEAAATLQGRCSISFD